MNNFRDVIAKWKDYEAKCATNQARYDELRKKSHELVREGKGFTQELITVETELVEIIKLRNSWLREFNEFAQSVVDGTT